MDITDPRIAEYLERVTPVPDDVLQEMAKHAQGKGFPYIGAQVGRLLHSLVLISGAKRVFEFGSGFGYSIYWMAKAAADGAELIGTEYNEDNVKASAEYFRRGKIDDHARVVQGEAFETFNSTSGDFDIIVCDAEKTQYTEIFKLATPRLKKGGLFIADNVLWSGEVVAESSDPETKAIQEFNKMVFADSSFHSGIIPIRDGILLAVRLK